ncbi:hypothetical protein COCSADRAFT_175741 [Bipolaris sorokiniana ND90Pr]|uniref:Uncharacterized protein n=1 Tax=Cochliobolus sativus (strain ND90Pr / ATCC 201652) TaxID=665912 RepID=M2QVR6_COCSN|nr:uncharacterized protein COCSADRAFT_175741 [Bipolaris sorokiniana ND90Pr]EMD59184.1 hypothetical protein COCSADRAFT_175741 [Bipolaris sorokiniana ND90Pr]
MSGAAGAPPPPPPPPGPSTHGNPFDDLPAELLLIIYEYVGNSNLVNLALAIYPTFQRHNLSPELTSTTLAHMLSLSSRPPMYPGIVYMPAELWLCVARYLEPADILSMMFTFGAVFGQPLTQSTRDRLRVWSRRLRENG